MDKWQAIDAFWNSFGWPAFDENSVPDELWDDEEETDLEPPYITYEAAVGKLDDTLSLSGNLWDNSLSWKNISNKADEIEAYIESIYPKGIEIDGGRMWITASRPFAQRLSAGRNDWKRIRIGINVEFFTSS